MSFSPTQKEYLDGFFAGTRLRGQSFASAPVTEGQVEVPKVKLAKEEKIKQELHPLDAFPELLKKANLALPPEGGDVFRFKSNGMFWLDPVEQGYMCRLRIPGGILTAHQFRELGSIASDLASGFLQVTTRNNLQIRVIQPEHTVDLIQRVVGLGLHTQGTGADNIRNLTMSPCAGLDPYELIDVKPLIDDLQLVIRNDRELYDLPRKFNISIHGGGLIPIAEDTNDIGLRAFETNGNILFQILLGGVTGHEEFAEHGGAVCTPEQAVEVCGAMTKVFARNGNRGNRGKARLVYLLKDWGYEKFVAKSEQLLGYELQRLDEASIPTNPQPDLPEVPHPHLGAFPQKQDGLSYLGVCTPVGHIPHDEVSAIADVAEEFGDGGIRMTIFQNPILTGIPTPRIPEAELALKKAGLSTSVSKFRGGMVACTGNRYCKYSSADTKGHGVALADFIDEHIELDRPINVHVTGCPHSCAQHYIGDIGLLGCKVENPDGGDALEGFHVFVGGGFGREGKHLGRQIFKSVPAGKPLQKKILRLLQGYLEDREEGQSFREFSESRSGEDLGSLEMTNS